LDNVHQDEGAQRILRLRLKILSEKSFNLKKSGNEVSMQYDLYE